MKTKEDILRSKRTSCLTIYSKKECLEAMKEYADQFKPKWVSVDDELPESTGNYIVCKHNGLVAEMYYRDDAKVFLWRNMEQTNQITHWMPLPEKPEK